MRADASPIVGACTRSSTPLTCGAPPNLPLRGLQHWHTVCVACLSPRAEGGQMSDQRDQTCAERWNTTRYRRAVISPLVFAGLMACMAAPTSEIDLREGNEPGECTDDADNDSDGLFDCDDPDCAGAVACEELDICAALEFDGFDDHVEVSDHPALRLDTGAPFTVEAWMWWDGRSKVNIVRKGSHPSAGWNLRINVMNTLSFLTCTDCGTIQEGALSGGRELPTDRWVHVAATFDGEFTRLWVDGQPDSAADIGVPTTDTVPLAFAEGVDGFRFGGLLDEVRISSVVRYDESFVPAASLRHDDYTIGKWSFSEASGTASYDESGNGYHGTLHGAGRVEDCSSSNGE
ncbi:MAG: LamG domain-containing protein [Deltaproteobacteria bacterium]|nr:MAG: LamG domain-containing protein [Deltaproteobacteria bacterium]